MPNKKMLLNEIIFCLCIAGFNIYYEDRDPDEERIVLTPVKGAMTCGVYLKKIDQSFAFGIPESIGSREHSLILNFPDVKPEEIEWKEDKKSGVASYSYSKSGLIEYDVKLTPHLDYIDLEMTIKNLTDEVWQDVFAFNCFNPVAARKFKDENLQRTYISVKGKMKLLADVKKTVNEKRPGLSFYLKEGIKKCQFADDSMSVSPERTDAAWIFRSAGDYYMAAANAEAVFLFSNTEFGCVHSAPNFGNIKPGKSSRIKSRFYVAKGDLGEFIKRYESDFNLRKKK
ncbi:MAG: hypothetical protein HY606_11630 [Planctomycetes bacterium]|nr:hypothetical protein [Planctomycetota bacterium]